MKITGIIAEYNPFHRGHAYHIQKAREMGATHIVVVMSGNFTQRGEPALLPKAVRTRAALAGGADLVVELPTPWAMATAERFVMGGVSILHGMGCVDNLCFGSECDDIGTLAAIAAYTATDIYKEKLRAALDSGISYPSAVAAAMDNPAFAAVLDNPNDTLGVEYCRALQTLHSPITPQTVLRVGAAHDGSTVGEMASAKIIREGLREGKDITPYIPTETLPIVKQAIQNGHCLTDTVTADKIILSHLRLYTKEQLAYLPAVSEGLENRLYTALRECSTLQQALEQTKTRRYTAARLRRIVTAAYIGLHRETEQQTPPYIRILGVGKNGADILKKMKDTATLPLFSDATQPPADALSKEIFATECKACDLYGSLLSTPLPCGREFTSGVARYPAEI